MSSLLMNHFVLTINVNNLKDKYESFNFMHRQ